MAMNAEQCGRMIEACHDASVALGVAYYRRFYPSVLRIKQLIDNGILGRPLSLLATTGNCHRFPRDDWRVTKSLGGGGPLMDIGSHRIDLFLELLGEVRTVQANCADSPDYEAEETASLLIEFNSGAHGILQCYFGTVNTPDRLELIGTDGRVTIDDLNGDQLVIVTRDGTRIESHPPCDNLHAPLVKDFSEAVEAGRLPRVCGEQGSLTNEIIAAAYRDADDGVRLR